MGARSMPGSGEPTRAALSLHLGQSHPVRMGCLSTLVTLQDAAPHTTHLATGHGSQTPIHSGRSILFRIVCL